MFSNGTVKAYSLSAVPSFWMNPTAFLLYVADSAEAMQATAAIPIAIAKIFFIFLPFLLFF